MTSPTAQLTEQQRIAVDHLGNMFLLACPGSGKTRTAASRIARLNNQGTSVAACSYTNVGVGAIREALFTDQQITTDSRSFVGTLHGLLLRHVTYPFGHLIHGTTPRLLSDDSSRWPDVNLDDRRRRLSVALFRMCPNGTMRMPKVPFSVGWSAEQVLARGSERAATLKRQMARGGWVTFDDAMYIALRVLREHPPIARAVAARYDEILVDEAQDTSELQIACLRALADTGALASLVLIGDLEQSISSHTGASPAACEGLASSRGLERVEVTQNHRSSQLVCNAAAQFCSRPSPDFAIGPDAAHPVTPSLLFYPTHEPRVAIELFHKRLIDLDEDPRHAAVLARSNDFCDKLNQAQPPCRVDKRPLAIGRTVAALRENGILGRHEIEQIDRIIAFTAFGHEELSIMDPDQRDRIRLASIALLHDAPDLDQDLRTWIKATAACLTAVAMTCTSTTVKTGGQVLRSANPQTDYRALDAFSSRARFATRADCARHQRRVPEHRSSRPRTRHQKKRPTRDAVGRTAACRSSRTRKRRRNPHCLRGPNPRTPLLRDRPP